MDCSEYHLKGRSDIWISRLNMHLSNSPFKSWWISRQMERITFWNPCQNISIEFVIRPIFDHPNIERKFHKYHLFYIFATHNCNTAHYINHNAMYCIIIHCTIMQCALALQYGYHALLPRYTIHSNPSRNPFRRIPVSGIFAFDVGFIYDKHGTSSCPQDSVISSPTNILHIPYITYRTIAIVLYSHKNGR